MPIRISGNSQRGSCSNRNWNMKKGRPFFRKLSAVLFSVTNYEYYITDVFFCKAFLAFSSFSCVILSRFCSTFTIRLHFGGIRFLSTLYQLKNTNYALKMFISIHKKERIPQDIRSSRIHLFNLSLSQETVLTHLPSETG